MIHASRAGSVLVIELDRPERRNALDLEHCQQLTDVVRNADARVIVLAGAGPHFCAGADLSAGLEGEHFVAALHDALEALSTVELPTIAAVHGAALGAGMQLAAACDLRVAESTARFGIPAARLGLMVDHWTVARVAALVGHAPAAAMLLAAEEYDGTAAHRIGFVQRLGDRAAALAWAQDITALAPLTIAGHKQGLRGPSGYADAFRRAWTSADLREGMLARQEKRAPRFEGR